LCGPPPPPPPPLSSQPPRASHNMRITGSRVLRTCFTSHTPCAQSLVNGSAGCTAADASAGSALFDLPQGKYKNTHIQSKTWHACPARRPSPSGHQRLDAASRHQILQLLHRALEIVSPERAAVVLPHLVESPQKTPGSVRMREQLISTQMQSRPTPNLCSTLIDCLLGRACRSTPPAIVSMARNAEPVRSACRHSLLQREGG
jgi:hypothetical protein